MILKQSKYNTVFKSNTDMLVFNTLNCILAKVNDSFLKILNSPNNVYEGEDFQLRDSMLNAGFLISNELDEVNLLQLRYEEAKYENNKLTLTIMPTMECNFRCFYCFENKTPLVMTEKVFEGLKKFVENRIRGIKKLKIVWFGGEPLLEKSLIWRISSELNTLCQKFSCDYEAVMVSNGYLLSDMDVEPLKTAKISTIQITIDGDAKFHDKRRVLKDGKTGTFNKIYQNMIMLANNNIKVVCRANLDKTNIVGIKNLVSMIAKENSNNIKFSVGQLMPITDDWNIENCLNAKEFMDKVNDIAEHMKENGMKVQNDYPFFPTPKKCFCGASKINSYVISAEGVIYKCWDYLAKPIGDVFNGIAKDSEKKINQITWLSNTPFSDKECIECKVLPLCMGGCAYHRVIKNSKQCITWKYNLEDFLKKSYLRMCGNGG